MILFQYKVAIRWDLQSKLKLVWLLTVRTMLFATTNVSLLSEEKILHFEFDRRTQSNFPVVIQTIQLKEMHSLELQDYQLSNITNYKSQSAFRVQALHIPVEWNGNGI